MNRDARPHLLHLTVLNPARHTRIFFKFAQSQVQMGWRVSIAGQDPAPAPYEAEGVMVYPQAPFPRLSWRRWRQQQQLARLVETLAPQVIMIHTPELLPMALRLQSKFGLKVVYDVHEDYHQNLRNALHYPAWLRFWLAKIVRQREHRALSTLSAVTYAEVCYHDMLGADDKAWIFPNLFSVQGVRGSLKSLLSPFQGRKAYFLYTGTLAEAWGVFEAIDCWESLYPMTQRPFVLAGHASQPDLLARLEKRMAESPFRDHLLLIGGAEYVPYGQIVALIQACYAGLGLYHALPYLKDKIPTKFYEFLALGKPLIYPAEPAWMSFGEPRRLGLALNQQSPAAIVQALDQWEALPEEERQEFFWESLDESLRELMNRLTT